MRSTASAWLLHRVAFKRVEDELILDVLQDGNFLHSDDRQRLAQLAADARPGARDGLARFGVDQFAGEVAPFQGIRLSAAGDRKVLALVEQRQDVRVRA